MTRERLVKYTTIFLLISPLLDVLAFIFISKIGVSISPATIIKSCAVLYLFFCSIMLMRREKSSIKPYIIIPSLYLVYAIIHMVLAIGNFNNLSYGSFFNEFQTIAIYGYQVLLLLTLVYLLKDKTTFNKYYDMLSKGIIYSSLIYSLLLLGSIATGTSEPAYNAAKLGADLRGYQGCFYPSHMIGHVSVISLPIIWQQLRKTNQFRYFIIFATVALSTFYLLGTKGSTWGALAVCAAILIIMLTKFIVKKTTHQYKYFALLLAMFILMLFTYTSTYTYHNINYRVEAEENTMVDVNPNLGKAFLLSQETNQPDEEVTVYSESITILQSMDVDSTDNRTAQLIFNSISFKRAGIHEKLFGIGYWVQPDSLYLETDAFSSLFNYGIFGFMFIYLPYIVIFLMLVFVMLRELIKEKNICYHKIYIALSMGMFFCLTLFVGYMLNRPTLINVYVTVFVAGLYSSINSRYINSNKIRKKAGQLIRYKNNKEHNTQVVLRKDASIFDIATLTAEMPISAKELSRDNSLYGTGDALLNYSDYKKDIMGIIEHGVNFSNSVPSEKAVDGLNGIITFNQRRVDILKEHYDLKVYKIGPYIHYCNPLFSDEIIAQEKQKNGKTLVVFPSHSIKGVHSNYDEQDLIAKIDHIKKEYNFDTVLLSFYFVDINAGAHIPFEKHGFKIITPGHKHDKNYLRRLKYIISLADVTMSNEIGTILGYCIYLNKPHYLYVQEIKYTGDNASKEFYDERLRTYKISEAEINSVFNYYSEEISDAQLDIYEKYWGATEIKNKQEIFDILDEMRNGYEKN